MVSNCSQARPDPTHRDQSPRFGGRCDSRPDQRDERVFRHRDSRSRGAERHSPHLAAGAVLGFPERGRECAAVSERVEIRFERRHFVLWHPGQFRLGAYFGILYNEVSSRLVAPSKSLPDLW